eukprot:COSAG01_NODE_8534_length_2749_cov_354.406415_4_plen_147_part_00
MLEYLRRRPEIALPIPEAIKVLNSVVACEQMRSPDDWWLALVDAARLGDQSRSGSCVRRWYADGEVIAACPPQRQVEDVAGGCAGIERPHVGRCVHVVIGERRDGAADIVRGDRACRDSADVTSPHPGTRRHRLRVQVHLYGCRGR